MKRVKYNDCKEGAEIYLSTYLLSSEMVKKRQNFPPKLYTVHDVVVFLLRTLDIIHTISKILSSLFKDSVFMNWPLTKIYL